VLGSIAPMERPKTPPRTAGLAWLALLGLLTAAAASALVLAGQPLLAGVLTVAAGTAFVVASLRAAHPRARFIEAVTERIGDAAILGAVAWVSVNEDTWMAGSALAAVATAYLAAYLRAKAVGLGFRVEEPIVERAIRFVVLGVGITQGGPVLLGALWLAVLISSQALVREAARVGRQTEAR
jgi:hypothetical protein